MSPLQNYMLPNSISHEFVMDNFAYYHPPHEYMDKPVEITKEYILKYPDRKYTSGREMKEGEVMLPGYLLNNVTDSTERFLFYNEEEIGTIYEKAKDRIVMTVSGIFSCYYLK